MNKRIINMLFLMAIFLYVFASFCRPIFKPKNIIEQENRYANKFENISMNSFLNGTLQNNFEDTFSDQIILSGRLKTANNLFKGIIVDEMVKSYYKNHDLSYLKIDNVNFYGPNNLVYSTRDLNDLKQYYDDKIDNYNNLIKKYPKIDFYAYYIEKDTDINFDTNEKAKIYEYLQSRINAKRAKFEINSFEEFNNYFYKTDHHWNYKGSYKAYTSLLKFMNIKSEPKEGVEKCLNLSFSGSKASSSIFSNILRDEFCSYQFDFDDMNITVNGIEGDYGYQNEYNSGQLTYNISYGNYYGGDDGEIIFSTNNKKLDNILIVGESYDNAILKLLAEKFNTTISIDLRNYNHYMKKDFDFDYYVKKYKIDKVLFIGNVDFYTMSQFMINN